MTLARVIVVLGLTTVFAAVGATVGCGAAEDGEEDDDAPGCCEDAEDGCDDPCLEGVPDGCEHFMDRGVDGPEVTIHLVNGSGAPVTVFGPGGCPVDVTVDGVPIGQHGHFCGDVVRGEAEQQLDCGPAFIQLEAGQAADIPWRATRHVARAIEDRCDTSLGGEIDECVTAEPLPDGPHVVAVLWTGAEGEQTTTVELTTPTAEVTVILGDPPDCSAPEPAPCGPDLTCDPATEVCWLDINARYSCAPLDTCAPGDCLCIENIWVGQCTVEGCLTTLTDG